MTRSDTNITEVHPADISYEEIDAALLRARRMRAEAMAGTARRIARAIGRAPGAFTSAFGRTRRA